MIFYFYLSNSHVHLREFFIIFFGMLPNVDDERCRIGESTYVSSDPSSLRYCSSSALWSCTVLERACISKRETTSFTHIFCLFRSFNIPPALEEQIFGHISHVRLSLVCIIRSCKRVCWCCCCHPYNLYRRQNSCALNTNFSTHFHNCV